MKLFVDSANLKEIEECLKRGFVSGVTTNPSLIAKEERRNYEMLVGDIIDLLRRYNTRVPLSVELTTNDVPEMIRQGTAFAKSFSDYDQLVIKVPIGWGELEVIAALKVIGAKINCTCVMSYNQAIIAANAGVDYVSIFWGRIRDIGYDAAGVVRSVRTTFDTTLADLDELQIIVGSIRQMIDVNEAIQAGADIVTVAPRFFQQMCTHPKTDEAVAQFLQDYKTWSEPS